MLQNTIEYINVYISSLIFEVSILKNLKQTELVNLISNEKKIDNINVTDWCQIITVISRTGYAPIRKTQQQAFSVQEEAIILIS